MTDKSPILQIRYVDPDEGWEGYLVIDSLVNGVSGGGLRVTKTVDFDEVRGLARAMSLKNHVMGLPLGGAKSAVRYDPAAPELPDVLTKFMRHIGPICQQMYGWGPDMNTPPDLCDSVADRAGMKSRHMALAERSEHGYAGVDNYNRALRLQVGPVTMTEARTAIGVVGATECAAKLLELGGPLRVAIQGFGSVGSGAVYFLDQRGHRIVGVADAGGAYKKADGLDFDTLLAAKGDNREIDPAKVPEAQRAGAPDAIFDVECDVLILAALSGALTEERARRVRAKMVVEGGNLAVTDAGAAVLAERGIPSVPDFIVNGGGIGIVSGVIQLGWKCDADYILEQIESRVAAATERTVHHAKQHGGTLREAAYALLPERLRP
ncbi:MAG: Glu/Leu/Phe/Val dehydrogenase dimerization domain-containing protein [Deltaproteobacteria bacterium]|jgi:glutamate dehydrogenase (NAD(P)+)